MYQILEQYSQQLLDILIKAMTCIDYNQFLHSFNFSTKDKMGSGTSATVYRISHKQQNMCYALKVANFTSADKLAVAFQQVQAIRAVDHPCAIKVYYYFVNIKQKAQYTSSSIDFGMIMELGDRSLEQDIFMRGKRKKFYSLTEMQQLTGTLIKFFASMQRKGYIHRDIKPDNILIMEAQQNQIQSCSAYTFKFSSANPPKYKVCDFGFAVKQHEFAGKNIAGTALFASPKLQVKFNNTEINIKGNNYKDDVYSLGVTLIVAGALQSVENTPPMKLLPKIFEKYGNKFSKIIQSMIFFDEKLRPDFVELQQRFDQYLQQKNYLLSQKERIPIILNIPQRGEEIINAHISKHKQVHQQIPSINQVFQQDKSIIQCDETTFEGQNNQNKNDVSLIQIKPQVYLQKSTTDQKLKIFPKTPANANKLIFQSPQKPQIIKQQQYVPDKPFINKYTQTYQKQPNKNKKRLLDIGLQNNLESNNNAIWMMGDKAKTKKRSKLLPNSNQNSINDCRQNKNKPSQQSFNRMIKYTHNQLNSTKPNSIQQQIEPSLHQSIQQIRDHPDILFKFQQTQKIELIQVIQLKFQPTTMNRVAICLIFQGKLFICTQNNQGKKRVTFVKFQSKLNSVRILKYNRKTQLLMLVCSNNQIYILNLSTLPQAINRSIKQNNPFVHSRQFQLILLQNQTLRHPITAIYFDESKQSITTALKNGQIYESNGLMSRCLDKIEIAYILNTNKFVYVATYFGFVVRYQNQRYINQQNRINTMMGCYDFKTTILAMQFIVINCQLRIAFVTVNGFFVIFNLELQKVGQKQITQQFIRDCKIDYNLPVGRRIIALTHKGNIINQLGDVVKQTKVKDAAQIFVVENGDKFIVCSALGTIYQIDTRKNQVCPTSRNKLVDQVDNSIESGKKKYLEQMTGKKNNFNYYNRCKNPKQLFQSEDIQYRKTMNQKYYRDLNLARKQHNF